MLLKNFLMWIQFQNLIHNKMLSNFSKYLELNSFNVDGKTFRKGKHSKAKTKRSQNILSYISQTFMKEDL